MSTDSHPNPDKSTARRRVRGRCRWSGCDKPLSDRYAGPLCNRHALEMWCEVYDHHLDTAPDEEAEQHEILRAAPVTKAYRDEMTAESRARRALVPKDERPGFIYYIEIGDVIKIGFATNLRRRLRAYPPSMKLLNYHPGTLKDEKALHQRFAHERRAGREWYSHGTDLMAHLKELRRVSGLPNTTIFLPRRVATGRPAVRPAPIGGFKV